MGTGAVGLVGLVVVIGLVALIGLFAMGVYNGLVKLRNFYKNSFSQIDVQLKRRHDLIPNLVETAKAYMSHERETLEAVISARNGAESARQAAAANPEREATVPLQRLRRSLCGRAHAAAAAGTAGTAGTGPRRARRRRRRRGSASRHARCTSRPAAGR